MDHQAGESTFSTGRGPVGPDFWCRALSLKTFFLYLYDACYFQLRLEAFLLGWHSQNFVNLLRANRCQFSALQVHHRGTWFSCNPETESYPTSAISVQTTDLEAGLPSLPASNSTNPPAHLPGSHYPVTPTANTMRFALKTLQLIIACNYEKLREKT